MEIKKDRQYADSHEWVLFENETTATIGISDFAQSELGDLVFVNLPQVGDELKAGEPLGDVESVKAVSDIYSPVSGKVIAVNEALIDSPQLINETPYDAWFCKVEGVSDRVELLSAEEYDEFVRAGQ